MNFILENKKAAWSLTFFFAVSLNSDGRAFENMLFPTHLSHAQNDSF